MFSPRGPTTRSKSSPFVNTPQSGRPQNRRVSNLFTPKGRTPSTKTPGNRSLQTSQVIEETGLHRVESYGTPLPVLITEALTLTDKHTEITVKIDPSGWAWLVGGRKLFIWRYKHGQTSKSSSVFCKELTLPPSDLAHNADRVCVIPDKTDNQSASCVAVSPEGVVRYWANIAYEGSSMEISAELRGEECACVINFPPYGCLLATTTSSLVLLTQVQGQTSMVCHPLKGSQGMFAGISRRMSSFIFGASPLQATGAPLQAIVPGNMDNDERQFYVLSGTLLQRWSVYEGCTEKLFYQLDADRMFRESLARKIWNQDSRHLTELKTWLLDMQPTPHGVVILAAGVNTEVNSILYFGLAYIVTEVSGTPTALDDLVVLDHTDRYEENTEYQLQNYRLLVPDSVTKTSYIYDKDRILFMPGNSPEVVDFSAPGGNILGAGICDRVGVFFSASAGMFSLSSAQKPEVSIMDEPMEEISKADMSVMAASSTQIQELSMSDDKTARLKSLFLEAMRGNTSVAQAGLVELFPLGDSTDGELDKHVVALSQDIIDDYPASDPRWAESRQDSSSSTTSLIILNQLNDKLKVHDYIINFLKKMGLWDRLTVVPGREGLMLTRNVLCEHAEKIQAAVALRQLHSEYSGIIDNSIRKVLERRGNMTSVRDLTPQDVFYREVSKIHEITESMIDYEEEYLLCNVTAPEIIAVVSSINAILEAMFHQALRYRESKADFYHCDVPIDSIPEFIPWTSTGGDRGIRSLLQKQYTKTLESAIPEVQDADIQEVLLQQLVSFADIILGGYACQLESLRRARNQSNHFVELQRRYEQSRQNLIQPLLEHERYELAASLAEKYLDFEILIQLCEQTNNMERIERYLTQFADKGFSDFLYSWYMKEGKRGKLMSLPIGQHAELGRFLQADDVKYLRWLHDIHTNNFEHAHEALLELAKMETRSLAKKKTLMSLSKLAGLAAEESNEQIEHNINSINEEQDLILHQEQLPQHLVENLGIDRDTMGVMSLVELIQLYISDDNAEATELDYKKALDLLQYIDQTDPNIDYDALKLQIWTKAALRDSWVIDSTGDPQNTIKDTIFFKTVDIAYREGINIQEFLPDLTDLLQCDSLGPLGANRNFQYLMKAGYEHIKQVTET